MAETVDVPPEEVLNVNVGVLGHVDSGKTSLVKTLSTLLSTAALDKSKESRQRGMTLDLGFSCFFLDLPPHLAEQYPSKSKLQMTLVDCPGHASLIRTIIGGAQIIDMVLLVVDACKGWQAQTTECLVLAELTSPHLVVALNKIDMFAPEERDELVEKTKIDVWKRLEDTRFADCTLVGVSACVGGEKVAASTGDSANKTNPTMNVEALVQALQSELPPPKRDSSDVFYFSIDHCFPIRGQGTVLTGTVLSGAIAVNQVIEFPTLALERKVKSMQMFRRKVQQIGQGDRAGICVSNLDSKLLERGIAASPGAVQLLKGAIALVRKVKYFHGTLKGGGKFHISVGHTTIMATITFWGARELLDLMQQQNCGSEASEISKSLGVLTGSSSGAKKAKSLVGHSSLGGDADMAGLPLLKFDFQQDFLHQDSLLEELSGEKATNLLHWAMLDFQTPVFCPLDSLIIGSRLDVEAPDASASSCRLAFSGRLVHKIDPVIEGPKLKLYTLKEKRGIVSKLGEAFRRDDDGKLVRYEVFGDELFKKETNMKIFTGMKLFTPAGDVGEIKGSYGTTGKFRVWFPAGTEAKEGDELILKFKRYAHDEKKEMHQDILLPSERVGTRIEVQAKNKKKKVKVVVGEVVSVKGDTLENGKRNLAIISGFFAPEINIRERVGEKVVISSTNEEGMIVGPFGKAGKCKVSFAEGISAEVGAKAELHTQ
jgi:selenocysteine-specific elongation factor